jgi:excisionase family DNA binding protein
MTGYVTAKNAAQMLSVSVKMIYKLGDAGELETLKVGRSVRILAASLHDFIARNTRHRAENTAPASAPLPLTHPSSPPPQPRRGKGQPSAFLFLPPKRS